MTSATDWTGRVGRTWAAEWQRTDRSFAKLSPHLDAAIRTAAPLSTAEVTFLLGARPGSALAERGGLRARRLNRNVWVLSRAEGNRRDSQERDDRNDGFGSSFHDGRRRF